MGEAPVFSNNRDDIDETLVNSGLMQLNQLAHNKCPRTFLISGMARGGTSLLAKLFHLAGIPIGLSADPVVFEDREVARALTASDRMKLQTVIAGRNAAHEVWGFKLPNLFDYMAIGEVHLFRNPSLVLIFRDPIAIAQRCVVSNLSTIERALSGAIEGQTKLVEFALAARCPVLLISYEKALAQPGRLVDALSRFGGWVITGAARARLVATVTVDNPVYWRTARIKIRGFIDRVVDRRLDGWCQIEGSKHPVSLELLVDGRVVAEFRADHFRSDLATAGIGDGHHGFSVDLTSQELCEDSVLTVQVKNRDFLLVNSGKSTKQLRMKDAYYPSPPG